MALLSGTTLTPTTEEEFHQYYATQYHRYEATYRDFVIGDNNQRVYVVNNRRLGNIDLTVTKNWVDGAGQLRDAIRTANEALGEGISIAPYLKLVFAEDSANKGTIEGSTVTVGENGSQTTIMGNDTASVNSMQAVNFSEKSEETPEYYFFNLPQNA